MPLIHTISVFRQDPQAEIERLFQPDFKQDYNINCTLVTEGIKVNTYANTRWKHNPSFVFDNSATFLAGWDSDVGSGGLKYTTSLSVNEQSLLLIDQVNKKQFKVGGRMTLESLDKKLTEISFRRGDEDNLPLRVDESGTDYLDINGAKMKTGRPKKYTSESANTDGKNQKIGVKELRHNEVHIKTNILYLSSVMLTESDLKEDNLDKKLLLFSAKKMLDDINHQKISIVNDDVKISKLVTHEIESLKFMMDRVVSISDHVTRLGKCPNDDPESVKEVSGAMNRKNKKNPSFDKELLENKGIYVTNRIKKLGEELFESKNNLSARLSKYDISEADLTLADAFTIGDLNKENKPSFQEKLDSVGMINKIKGEVVKIIQIPTKLTIYSIETGTLKEYKENMPDLESFKAEIMKLSAEDGFVNKVVKSGCTTLEQCREVITDDKFALQVDYQDPNRDGATLLHYAASKGDSEMLQKLIKAGANINVAENDRKFTSLHSAIERGNVDVANILIGAKANLELKNSLDQTVLTYALTHTVKDQDAQLTLIKNLIDKGANLSADGEKNNALLNSVFSNDLRIIDLVASAYSNKNIKFPDKGRTAAHALNNKNNHFLTSIGSHFPNEINSCLDLSLHIATAKGESHLINTLNTIPDNIRLGFTHALILNIMNSQKSDKIDKIKSIIKNLDGFEESAKQPFYLSVLMNLYTANKVDECKELVGVVDLNLEFQIKNEHQQLLSVRDILISCGDLGKELCHLIDNKKNSPPIESPSMPSGSKIMTFSPPTRV
jgi:hypothetical protein